MPDDLEHQLWLRTDEIKEFIDALERTAEFAQQLAHDLKAWKWLIIALHSALQGACVCALRGHDTAGVTMLTRHSWKQMWQWLDVELGKNPAAPMPEERLASLKELFTRVRDPGLLPSPHTLRADAQAVADITKLNSLRNKLVHFVPRGLSLELSGMPRIVGHAADAIEHLAVEHPTFWHHLNQSDRNRIAVALAGLRRHVDAWSASL